MVDVMYKYDIYGLIIASEIKLYQLKQTENEKQEDVQIRYETVEEKIAQDIQKGIPSQMLPGKVWFHNDVGCFIIKDGKEILVDACETATEEDVASFLLGYGISFLFMQREVPALHCSALEMHEQAIVIAGNSGAGKSTIALALLKKGYKYLADDIAMIDIQKDFLINPGFPQQKVCRNVAESMQEKALFYINEKKDKFAYNNIEDFCTTPRKLTTMFVLEVCDREELSIQRLTGLDKWNQVINHLFLREAYEAFGLPGSERTRCLQIAGNIEMYAIYRPRNQDTVDAICDKIVEIVKS